VSFHTAADEVAGWDLDEIYQVMNTVFPVDRDLKADLSEFAIKDSHKLDKAKARTKIIEHLVGLAKENYGKMAGRANSAGINWTELEKAVLIRSIDALWIEHLETMSSVRQGIGLRGYGQRDPLVEYKKEAYRLYNELNSLIQKEVVYSIYKVGGLQTEQAEQISAPSLIDRARTFSAPAKVMSNSTASFAGFKKAAPGSGSQTKTPDDQSQGDIVRQKVRDESGKKVGRNDPCPCGSGKKYKKCHGQ